MERALPTLAPMAMMLCRDRDSAEDLVQTTVLRVARRWPTARRDPIAYARKVLFNLYLDGARQTARRPRLVPLNAESDLVAVDPTSANVDNHVLLAALASLGQQHRAVLVLRFYLDMSVSATARTLGIPEGTVKSATARALSQLRAILGDSYAASASTEG